MTRYIILIGSNIQPETNLPAALDQVRNNPNIALLKYSGIYESPAVMASNTVDIDRPSYLNAALLIDTELDGNALRCALRDIESQLGRQRGEDKYADRTADLDIIATYVPGGVAITDPAVREMAFAALPSAEVAAEWEIDSDGRTIGELAKELRAQDKRIRRI